MSFARQGVKCQISSPRRNLTHEFSLHHALLHSRSHLLQIPASHTFLLATAIFNPLAVIRCVCVPVP